MTPEDFVRETLEDRGVSTFGKKGRCPEGGDRGIEGGNPPKAAALTAKYGGKFLCNLIRIVVIV